MSDKIIEAPQLPNPIPAMQVMDYWSELAAIASYAWFNGAMIFAAGVAEED